MKIEMQIKWLQREAEECLEDERPLAAAKYEEISESLTAQYAEIEQITDDASSWHSKYLRQSAEDSIKAEFIGSMLRRRSKYMDGYAYEMHLDTTDPLNAVWEQVTEKNAVSTQQMQSDGETDAAATRQDCDHRAAITPATGFGPNYCPDCGADLA